MFKNQTYRKEIKIVTDYILVLQADIPIAIIWG
jgi:hypothetical protein